MSRRPQTPDSDLEHIAPDLHALAADVDSLHADPRNPRVHDQRNREAVQFSLQRFGQRAPIVATKDGLVVAGNLRLEVARQLGWRKIAVTRIGSADAAAFGIADNRTAELADWEEARLAEILREIDDDVTLASLGWTPEELEALLLDDLPEPEGEREVSFTAGGGGTDPRDEIPEARRTRVQVGDVWELGEHRLLCGDCYAAETVARLLGDEGPVDLVLTDPPFAIYGSSTGVGIDVADDRMVRPFFEQLARQISAALRIGAHAYVCCDWRSYPALCESLRAAPTALSRANLLVWDKGDFGLGTNYRNCHELVAFVHHAATSRQMTGKGGLRRGRGALESRPVNLPNILRVPRVRGEERVHNAQKPVELFARLIEASTGPGDRVLDMFAGSGTTAIACTDTNRRARILEVDPGTCDVILERWEKHASAEARKVSSRQSRPKSKKKA